MDAYKCDQQDTYVRLLIFNRDQLSAGKVLQMASYDFLFYCFIKFPRFQRLLRCNDYNFKNGIGFKNYKKRS